MKTIVLEGKLAMFVTEIKILNILCFQRQYKRNRKLENDGITLKFHDGINVLIGATGTGKTSILKLLYASLYISHEENQDCPRCLSSYFSNTIRDNSQLRNIYHLDQYSGYRVKSGQYQFDCSLLDNSNIYNFKQWVGLNIPFVYIPTDEMLTNAQSFFSITNENQIPFDATQNDIIIKASYPDSDHLSANTLKIIDKFDMILKSVVVFENDEFLFKTKYGDKVPLAFESTSTKKLGLLSKLLRNGSLEPGSILIWDEPENGMHPELFLFLVDILLDLQENGVQIFITTNSYSFAKSLEIRRRQRDQVRFYNLYRDEVTLKTDEKKKEKTILCQSSYYFDKLSHNEIFLTHHALLNMIDILHGYY